MRNKSIGNAREQWIIEISPAQKDTIVHWTDRNKFIGQIEKKIIGWIGRKKFIGWIGSKKFIGRILKKFIGQIEKKFIRRKEKSSLE